MREGWMISPGATNHRLEQPAWNHYWSGWRSLHPFCVQHGLDMIALDYGTLNSVQQRYAMCTFLLDWDGTHGWYVMNTSSDPWASVYDQAAALGQPTGAATKSGNVWSRQFQNGLVTVDPVAGTASIV
jgi:hypothetical protein